MKRGTPESLAVYPAYNALYYGFYLAGLKRLGVEVVHRRHGFPELDHHGLAIRAPGGKVFLSASDGPGLNPAALAWCDVFGKANLDPDTVPSDATARVLAIGPSFPVRAWDPASALVRAAWNFAACRGRVSSPREHFANFYRQWRYRLPLSAYEPTPSTPGYVFFASTLWRKEEETNLYRGRFVEVCQALPGVDFEGGFVPRRRGRVPGFDALTTDRRYTLAEYVERTRRSAVVFNTPAVASCHGWKLAEFLALGKAIVTTPPKRALPAPLVHGRDVEVVDGSPESIRAGVEHILRDDGYRRRLEENARAYYLRYLSPERVLERVFAAISPDSP